MIACLFDGEASRAQFRRKIRWYADRYGDQPIVYDLANKRDRYRRRSTTAVNDLAVRVALD